MTMTPSTDWPASDSTAERTDAASRSARLLMVTAYPAVRAARSMASSVDAGPNSLVSKLITPIVRDRRVTRPRASALGR
jgi:translation initiation factor RLI1